MTTLRYGNETLLELELADGVLVGHCDAPYGITSGDVAGAAAAALARPTGFPPLARCVVPGDRVALALESSVPRAPAIVAAVVEALVAAGVDADHIAIVRTQADVTAEAADPLSELFGNLPQSVRQSIHDPADRAGLCYLAASSEGKPIYINRMFHEADFVLTIGCLRLDEISDYHGINGALFPTFSDAQTIKRYCSPAAAASSVQRKRLRYEADEASWLLGSSFTMQVVPAASGAVLHVLAGESSAVFEQGKQLCAKAWNRSLPRRASLVIAAIAGDAGQQTWHSLGRALAAASRVVTDEGTIVLCTELREPPGPGLQQIAGTDDLNATLRQIGHDRPVDALVATQVAQALQRGRLYLLSRLENEVVENIGIAPISAASEIPRLASRATSCILLGGAQFAAVKVAGEAPPRRLRRSKSRALESGDV